MPHRRLQIVLLGLAAALLLAVGRPAAGQAPPTTLAPDLLRQPELNDQQRATICAFVKQWTDLINNEQSGPEEVERARSELVRVLNQPNAASLISPAFRFQYSQCAAPELQRALSSQNLYRAVNAAVALASLGTDRAASLLLEHADLQNETRWQVRLHAAGGMRLMIQSGMVEARRMNGYVRSLAEAAARENNGLILRHQLAAIEAADGGTLGAEDRRKVRGMLADALVGVARNLLKIKQPTGPMIDAVTQSVGSFGRKFLTLETAEGRSLGAQLGPALGDLFTYAQAQWETSQKDPDLSASMGRLVGATETFLQGIDASVKTSARPSPPDGVRRAWEGKDKTRFDSGVQAWQSVLTKPPYKE